MVCLGIAAKLYTLQHVPMKWTPRWSKLLCAIFTSRNRFASGWCRVAKFDWSILGHCIILWVPIEARILHSRVQASDWLIPTYYFLARDRGYINPCFSVFLHISEIFFEANLCQNLSWFSIDVICWANGLELGVFNRCRSIDDKVRC